MFNIYLFKSVNEPNAGIFFYWYDLVQRTQGLNYFEFCNMWAEILRIKDFVIIVKE